MDAASNLPLLKEDVILYIMRLFARRRGSRVLFKISHNLSLDRGWHFWCAPDMDLVEVRPDNTIVAYEVKGQHKQKGESDWPAIHDGLDQALAYLTLPKVTNEKTNCRMFAGGAVDLVYLVHPLPSKDSPAQEDLNVISLTPVGFMGVLHLSTPRRPQMTETEIKAILIQQLNRIIEVVPAKQNPLQDSRAKVFFLENLSSLEKFGEQSRTFRRRVERAGIEYLRILPADRHVVDGFCGEGLWERR